jgi:hypothetical protein
MCAPQWTYLRAHRSTRFFVFFLLLMMNKPNQDYPFKAQLELRPIFVWMLHSWVRILYSLQLLSFFCIVTIGGAWGRHRCSSDKMTRVCSLPILGLTHENCYCYYRSWMVSLSTIIHGSNYGSISWSVYLRGPQRLIFPSEPRHFRLTYNIILKLYFCCCRIISWGVFYYVIILIGIWREVLTFFTNLRNFLIRPF